LQGFTPQVREGYGAWFPANIPLSSSAKDILSKLLEYDPAVRLSVTEALQHPFFNGEASTAPILESVVSSLHSFQKDTAFKRAILDVMAESFSPDELQDAKASFAKYDDDGDGFITIDELRAHKVTAQSEALMKLLHVVDIDGDGKISYDELVKVCIQKKLLAKEERIYNVFTQLDADGNGYLTAAEVGRILDDEDMSHARDILSEIDKDGDGKIEYNEFLNMFFDNDEMSRNAEMNM
jgi:calcium-dependent protein kinase